MNNELEKKIYDKVMEYFDELNDFLDYTKIKLDKNKIKKIDNIDNLNNDIKEENYLNNLIYIAANINNKKIKVFNINQSIILNFINTILEELNIEEIKEDYND